MTEEIEKPKPKRRSKAKEKKGKSSRNHRIPVHMLVSYKEKGNYLFDFSQNLGEGGIFIETETPPAPGTTIDLMFTLPTRAETVSAKGKVIWVQPPVENRLDLHPGMGVQFVSFADNDKTLLQEFLREVESSEGAQSSIDEPSS